MFIHSRSFSRGASRIKRNIGLGALTLLLTTQSSMGQTNSWTKSTTGSWEEPVWSLGVLPNTNQSVVIANPGWKAVFINPTTRQNYPSSMRVKDLTIASPDGGQNTLLLNSSGTNTPLRVLNGLKVGIGGTLRNLYSGIVVENGSLDIEGQMVQDGGFIQALNGAYMLGGDCHMTNGLVEIGTMSFFYPSSFNQYGGKAAISYLNLLVGGYSLVSGTLTAGEILLYGQYGSPSFSQQGGTNTTSSLSMYGPPIGSGGEYFMDGGLLNSSNVYIGPRGVFSQNGGVHNITGTLQLEGDARYYPPQPISASYTNTGLLTAQSIKINNFGVFSSSGTVNIRESLQFVEYTPYVGKVFLSGMLTCSNVVTTGTGVDIEQSGGTIVVTNLFSFGGYYVGVYSGIGARYARYTFSNGSLTASNIDLAAEWIIGSSTQASRITNTGYFKMAGILQSGDATEQLGRFILASNSTINLGGGKAKLSFAASSAETWNSAAKLTVTNWSGLPTGGGDDRLKFGGSQSGLTPAQVLQIRFIDPSGFPTGEHRAQILSTGEIVPVPRPVLSRTKNGNNLVLNWVGNFSLQTSTNVAGPYTNVMGAISPHTNNVTGSSARFFRLRE